jgi:amidase
MAMVRTLIVAALLFLAACSTTPVDLTETTVTELQQMMQQEELSAEQLTEWYLERIEEIDDSGPMLNAVIEINPDALDIARTLDAERRERGPRGPMHGIPVLLKANIDTGDTMPTSAGSLALAQHIAPDDAFLVQRLRESGAIILGKANLSEWANFRSDYSSSGWSSVGGQTRNPYAPRRNPCGSSSGSGAAVAANLTAVAIGTETNGSVVCPSGANGIVGIKPTLGVVSRDGIIPIAHSQDTAGPMARTVRDAALLLEAMAAADPGDAATTGLSPRVSDFTSDLSPDGLRGKRIGVIRNYWGAGHPATDAVLDASIESLRLAGAEIIDDIELEAGNMYDASYTVLLFEFKTDLEKYLRESGAPIQTLDELIQFNEDHSATVMPYFGQDVLLEAQASGTLDDAEYLEALQESKRLSSLALDSALEDSALDALIAPTNGPAWFTDHINGDNFGVSSSSFAAISGYPNVTVPAGFHHGLPLGLSFIGRRNGDKALIEIAYAFEQATRIRRPPDN